MTTVGGGGCKWLANWCQSCLMRFFHPGNSFIGSRNLWLILLSKSWIFDIVRHIRIPNVLIFLSSFSGCRVINNFVIFH
jgi:hypothetical protein